MDSNHIAIDARGVSKSYRLFSNKSNKLVELVRNKNKRTIIHALREMSFQVNKGECLGLMGLNGSGKSTLANMIAGTVTPSSGQMIVNGEAACISVSVGLNPGLTGKENIEYKGLLLGFSPAQIKEMIPKVIEFADIGDYINQPVKYYSSGMSARLGFAISINVNPEVLVIDEGLSVGDQGFTDKCLVAMNEYRARGNTIIYVSHTITAIREFCDKAIWLEYGHMKGFGDADGVCTEYHNFFKWYNELSGVEKSEFRKSRYK